MTSQEVTKTEQQFLEDVIKNQLKIIALFEYTKDVVKEHNWIVKMFASDKDGEECSPTSPSVDGLCFSGAMHKAVIEIEADDEIHTLSRLIAEKAIDSAYFQGDLGASYIVHFNDNMAKTKNDIIEAIDKIIEYVKELKT